MSPVHVAPDVLSGHLGHLSPDQQAAFAVFKRSLEDARLYTPPSLAEGGNSHASHDEPTLLRFLRARRFDPPKALKQFQDAQAWRAQHAVDALYAAFDPTEFEDARRFYPRWTGRRDKNGLPVYVYRLASLAPYKTELFAIPPERRYQRIVALYETMTRFILPLCTHLPHATAPTPVSSVTTIIDLQDVTLSAIWSLRGHLQEASTLATANYPETLNTIAVVNSPSFFPTIWNWVKGCFDEGTQRKVHVLGKDPGPTLRTLIHAKDLPRVYGGELDWNFEHEPALDEHAIKALGEMPKGPVIFEDGELRKPTPPASAEKTGP
ncbi:CRAL/TRIO domain-containing protein [Laetiporus sulphureus 93-53]|uniref:CRAL/TRIO domain-containing protein n=1 Tax=Laetiporus sulphureus 93-53 TaxID=1314785 RepID=A0A165HIA4_9APHY|nr:CRAL/TRIO domain-containing protein [Laetiporus sulphureus 93-53]KZT11765.1 CRAL/TRIO domain-containing protein [Laetiporus sulphureus 93-53]